MYVGHMILWHRYIDDVFRVWDVPLDKLQELTFKLNTSEFNLSFTMSCSQGSLPLLDVTISKNNDSCLISNLYPMLIIYTYGRQYYIACQKFPSQASNCLHSIQPIFKAITKLF